MATAVVLKHVQLGYPHLDKPQPPMQEGGKWQYSGRFVMLPGYDPAVIQKLRELVEKTAIEKWGPDAKKLLANGKIANPIKTEQEPDKHPEGSVFIDARTDTRPGTVLSVPGPDGKPKRIDDLEDVKAQFYAGAFVNASLSVFAYDKGVKKGVSFGLNNVQFVRDGERLSGRKAAEDEFDVDLSQVPADLADVLT